MTDSRYTDSRYEVYEVYVLWGQGFDEIAASIFVGKLRHAGIRVKVVGLSSRHIPGQHGLALIPDCTLEQALYKANRIRCIIIPAPWAALQQFSYDPRLAELLRLAMRNQALIVVSALPQPTNPQTYNTFLPELGTQLDNIVTYPDVEELLMFTGDALLLWLQRE